MATVMDQTLPERAGTYTEPEIPEVTNGSGRTVPAVVKTVSIVRFLNNRGAEGASAAEVADALGLTRSHCHGILRTLVHSGWLVYHEPVRRYRLSSQIAADCASGVGSREVLDYVVPSVLRASETAGLPATVCEPVADGSYLVVYNARQPDPLISSVPTGFRFPPGTPPQLKPALAWLDAQERAAALETWQPVAFTEKTIVERDRLVADLEKTRSRGYAVSDGEFVDGYRTLGLPVFNRDGNVLLTVTIAGRVTDVAPRESEIARVLAACVAEIHRNIGGRPPMDLREPEPRT